MVFLLGLSFSIFVNALWKNKETLPLEKKKKLDGRWEIFPGG